MLNNIIEQSDPGIVAKETPVRLSDEKLRNMLSRTYERAQKDVRKPKLCKFYGVFLSIAGTLLLSLLTSTFRAVGEIKAEYVTSIAWMLCAGSAAVGFVLLWIAVSEKMKNDTTERDAAVDEVFNHYFSKQQD